MVNLYVIRNSTGSWMTEILPQIVNHADIQTIQASPPLNTNSQDSLTWKFSSTGVYTLRLSLLDGELD